MDNKKKIRVRFAPSPTGGLHLGGIRTVLYNYLFAKKFNGKFILRIEDTDQKRFVPGAEDYILECLKWLNIEIDESHIIGGKFGPYKQSERKHIYQKYINELIDKNYAYYAFDTPEELENMRTKFASTQYDSSTRMQMKNSLTLGFEETKKLITNNTPYVIRIKIPKNEKIIFNDLLRGNIEFDSNLIDDKVLIKADGLPTYHFAVVIDDYLMKISHVFRGEEWLPSAPVHKLIWQYLNWQNEMPKWIHLPLILKPDGNGKLSKRDGQRLGIPTFALEWKDPFNNEKIEGFKEKGFLKEAVINFLVMISWNNKTEQEIFSLEELIQNFSIENLHHNGAKFDYEKAKWYNSQYIQKTDNKILLNYLNDFLIKNKIETNYNEITLLEIINLTKDRCQLISDFYYNNKYLFHTPESIDNAALIGKWNENKINIFLELIQSLNNTTDNSLNHINDLLHNFALQKNIKLGEIQLPLRIMLVGGKFGISVSNIISIIGIKESINRINNGIKTLNSIL